MKKLFDLKTKNNNFQLEIVESRFNEESGYYSHFVKQSEILPSGLEIARYTWIRSKSENPSLEGKKIIYIFQAGYPVILSENEDINKSAENQIILREGKLAVDNNNKPVYFRSAIVDSSFEDSTVVETANEEYVPENIKGLIEGGLTYIHPLYQE